MAYAVGYQFLIYITCVLTVILNLVILPLILHYNKWILPSLKIIMMVFACTNVAHYILDVFTFPRSFQADNIAILLSEGFYQSEYSYLGKPCLCLLLSLLCIQIFNECLHFVYRYIILCKPRQAFLVNPRNLTLILLILIPLLGAYQFITAYIQPSPQRDLMPQSVINSLETEYDISIDDIIAILFLFQDYSNGTVTLPRNGYLFGILLFGPAMVFFNVMLFCAFKTHGTVVKAAFTMSASTQKQNTLFFRMLVVQSIVPMILLHIPGMILFFGPLAFVLNKDILDILMMTSLTCPALEPLIVIYFLTKGKFNNVLRCCSKVTTVSVSTVSHTTPHQSMSVNARSSSHN